MKKLVLILIAAFFCTFSGETFAIVAAPCPRGHKLASLVLMVIFLCLPIYTKYLLLKKHFTEVGGIESKNFHRIFVRVNLLLYTPQIFVIIFFEMISARGIYVMSILAWFMGGLLFAALVEQKFYDNKLGYEQQDGGNWRAVFKATFVGWLLASAYYYLVFILRQPEYGRIGGGECGRLPQFSNLETFVGLAVFCWVMKRAIVGIRNGPERGPPKN